MTSRELQIAVTHAMEEAGFSQRLFSKDVFRVLTEAQEMLYREYASSFEENRIVTDVLQSMVRRGVNLNASPGDDATYGFYADRFALPNDFGYYLSGSVTIAYNRNNIDYDIQNGVRHATGDYTSIRRLARHVQIDDIFRVLDDPFSRSTRFEPVVTTADGKISVYCTPQMLASSFYLDYLLQPEPITESVEPSLPIREHPRLVTAASQLLKQRLLPSTPTE